MQTRMLLLAALTISIACAGQDQTPSSPAALSEAPRAGTTRAEREAEQALVEPARDEAPPNAQPAAQPELLRVTRVSVSQAEDGHGENVTTTEGLAFDLDSARFPARALDPVLHVGELQLTQYTHPTPTAMRFVLSGSVEVAGMPVSIQYGDEEPTVLTQSLVLR